MQQEVDSLQIIITEFLKKNHMLSKAVIEELRKNTYEEPLNVLAGDLVCTKCHTKVINWVQLGKYRCPPRDRRNPFELQQGYIRGL